MNIRNSFVSLSYIFRMSANKLSYEKFTQELRQNYERDTTELQMFTNICLEIKWRICVIRIQKWVKIGCFLTTYLTTDYIGWPDFRDVPLTNF